MSTDKERLEILLAHLRLNPSELAKSLGYARTQRIYFVLNERNGISASLARDICGRYNDVSYDWLVSGEGEMLKATEGESKSIGHAIGAAIGCGLAQSSTGINTAVAAAYPLGISGVIGALFGNLLDTEEDITDDEAVEVLKEALEDAKKTTKENEELKQEIEYWRQKANNLEYELSKSQTKVG